ncbi:hypothetical protein [Burkholderia plantarii]|uniref:hypothetical protein n=1 Tax=Burkholderia plantarii TaxID=41899 RepID=UPI0018DD5190|nr:hypothetical protein [Burkholderia plantarii]MBI0327293.1 hypothetical protein [Burkholderia plantarii]
MSTLAAGDPASAPIAPEYLPPSVDAVQTWSLQGAGYGAWIDGCNTIPQAFVPLETALAPPPHNDALSYLLFENEVPMAGRRLVYISDSDAVYRNPQGRRGIFLAVNWHEELRNAVPIQRDGVKRQEMTLADLLRLLDGNRAGYNIFRRSEVWVVGDFPPFLSP